MLEFRNHKGEDVPQGSMNGRQRTSSGRVFPSYAQDRTPSAAKMIRAIQAEQGGPTGSANGRYTPKPQPTTTGSAIKGMKWWRDIMKTK